MNARRVGILGAAWAALVASTAVWALDDPDYVRGLERLDQRRYDAAIAAFDAVLERGDARRDAALYWRAHALGRVGRVFEAVQSLDELRQDFPASRWVDDALALRFELSPPPVTAETSVGDPNVRAVALPRILRHDPQRGLREARSVLRSPAPLRVRAGTLTLLVQTGRPEAIEVLYEVAVRQDEPELARIAVRQLGALDLDEGREVLDAVFRTTPSLRIRIAVLDGFYAAGDRRRLASVARDHALDEPLRAAAVQYLGRLRAHGDLDAVYREATSADLKEAVLRGYVQAGRADRVFEIARRSEPTPLRENAVRFLGVMGADPELRALRRIEPPLPSTARRAIVDAWYIRGNTEELRWIASEDEDPGLRSIARTYLARIRPEPRP